MKKSLMILSIIIGALFLSTAYINPVAAADVCTGDLANSDVCKQAIGKDENTLITAIIETLLFLIGAIAVIMIIVSGVRYVTSAGNPNAIAGAKNTLMYSITGLIIAIFAYAIVQFIVSRF